jgi:hypothetical protein
MNLPVCKFCEGFMFSESLTASTRPGPRGSRNGRVYLLDIRRYIGYLNHACLPVDGVIHSSSLRFGSLRHSSTLYVLDSRSLTFHNTILYSSQRTAGRSKAPEQLSSTALQAKNALQVMNVMSHRIFFR